MRIHSFAIAALSVVAIGCTDLTKGDDIDSAVITVATFSSGAGSYQISPIGLFYEKQNLGYTVPTAGACATRPFLEGDLGQISGFGTMDVGPHLLARLPAREDTLYGVTQVGIRLYKLESIGGVPHQPGDTLTIGIPQSPRFPESSISIRTAEAFTFEPVPVPAVNQPLTVTWTDNAEAGSMMHFSLRYANEFSTGVLNEQVVCVFADDGSGTIDGSFLSGWVNSVAGERQAVATRVRAREVQPAAKKRVTIISTFQSPPTSAPVS